MSAVSLSKPPSYTSPPDFHRTPSYAREPRQNEQRLAHGTVLTRRAADFVKQNKGASIVLRLSDQPEGAEIPTYGLRAPIEVRLYTSPRMQSWIFMQLGLAGCCRGRQAGWACICLRQGAFFIADQRAGHGMNLSILRSRVR